MTLYNMTRGVNIYAKVAIMALHTPLKSTMDFGRLRDAFFELHNGQHRIRVHTRNGGGNRDSYQSAIDDMRAHPWFAFDEDCSHDNTYADFVFNVPESIVSKIDDEFADLKKQHSDAPELWLPPVDHGKRFGEMLAKLGVGS